MFRHGSSPVFFRTCSFSPRIRLPRRPSLFPKRQLPVPLFPEKSEKGVLTKGVESVIIYTRSTQMLNGNTEMIQQESRVSEYIQIRRYVLTLIQKAGGKAVPLPSIQELAEQFQVSRPTVSRAMKALTDEGYVIGRRGIGSFTNPAKTFICFNNMPTVGLILRDGKCIHFDKFFASLWGHLMMEITRIPALVHLITLYSGDPDEILQQIRNEQLDALVWHSMPAEYESVPSRLIDSGLPVICSERPPAEKVTTTVRFGLRELGYECGKKLIAEGRRNLVFLPTDPPWNIPLAGIRKAYEEAGIPLNENLFLKNMQTCLEDLRKLLSFGVSVDAVFNSLYQQNEVADILQEFHIDLQNQCRLIESDLCIPGDKPFCGYVYHFEFQKHAQDIAALLKRTFEGEKLPPEEVLTRLRLESRGLPDCRS